jgi:hypothetical protein
MTRTTEIIAHDNSISLPTVRQHRLRQEAARRSTRIARAAVIEVLG